MLCSATPKWFTAAAATVIDELVTLSALAAVSVAVMAFGPAAFSVTLNAHPQDLGELVSTVVDRLQPRLVGRAVSVEIAEVLPPVPCDYAQIEQVLTNLLENAALHTESGTPVTARALRQNGVVRIEVEDQGRGIPATERDRLFRPFERGQTRAPGSGLGLTIARGFVEAHGGKLWLENGSITGSRFVFTLPIGRSDA